MRPAITGHVVTGAVVVGLAVLAFAPGAASQQTPAAPAPAQLADPSPAPATPPALLAAACANCHGYEGRGAWPIASIAGRPYREIYQQLDAWRRGEAIDDATVMTRLMAGYSEADIETLARWFSALPANPE